MYAIAKESLTYRITDRITDKQTAIYIRKGARLKVVVYGYHPQAKKRLQLWLKHGEFVFAATEGFRLRKFTVKKNIAIPFMWYKLLNLIKPTN